MRCLIDMDGVVVDLLTGWVKRRGLTLPTPYPVGVQRFDLLFKDMTLTDPWDGCDEKFWAELPLMPDAKLLVHSIVKLFGAANIFFVTSIVGPPASAAGKIHWLAKNFPGLSQQYFITSNRGQLANYETILVDDELPHIEDFASRGGKTVLYPTLWNSRHLQARKAHIITLSALRFITEETRNPNPTVN